MSSAHFRFGLVATAPPAPVVLKADAIFRLHVASWEFAQYPHSVLCDQIKKSSRLCGKCSHRGPDGLGTDREQEGAAMAGWLRKSGKVTSDTARRITGISVPFGGIQWAAPGPTDTEIVRRFLLFLEDRRVLYNAMDLEVVSQVEHSIHQIREECTKTLQALAPKVFAVTPVRAIREAGRRFHDDRNEEFRFFDGLREYREGSPGFFAALGTFRAMVGQQVVLLAAHYDIDIEGDLAKVLPTLEDGAR